MKTIRPNYAEGKFYPADPEALKQLFKETIQAESPNINFDLTINPIIGGVVPHAGYIFCAKEAVHFFDIVKYSEQTFDVVIIINPNHTGQGLPVSVDQHDFWQSPLALALLIKSWLKNVVSRLILYHRHASIREKLSCLIFIISCREIFRFYLSASVPKIMKIRKSLPISCLWPVRH